MPIKRLLVAKYVKYIYVLYSKRTKRNSSKLIPKDCNAFSYLQESLDCVISRINIIYFVICVKLNNRYMRFITELKFRFLTFQIQKLNLYKIFKMPLVH